MIGQLYKIILIVFINTIPLSAQSTVSTITLLTEDNEPYTFRDKKTGVVTGPGTRIILDLFKATEIPYTVTLLPWLRAYRRAETDANTCLFMTNRTPIREDRFLWVGPIMLGVWAIYKRPGSDITITHPQDLKNYNVIAKYGSAAAETLEGEGDIKILKTGSDEAAAKMLFHGRADLWVSGVRDGPSATQKVDLPAPAIAMLWKSADLSLACSKNTDLALVKKLQDANTARLKKMEEVIVSNDTSK